MAGNNKRPFSQHLHKTRSHNSSRSVYYATYAHNCISPLNISLILFTYRRASLVSLLNVKSENLFKLFSYILSKQKRAIHIWNTQV